ncbi:cysteine synthase family protein [Clostridium sp. HBUAS56017]|uniref:PLP-dependent cysteine synthase family protein n=1 Tax=Clostridium sp. HBUAS56017 TaxID=2571128 RepID=UPI0011787B36|nr:cysteine synthase family protein [Clostridium sp. HBUAS56017]
MDKYSLVNCIGNTPIVKLNQIVPKDSADIYVKLEGFNPGGSHKTRIALNMIEEAEKSGILVPNSGQTIIEGTGGNTGTGLAIAGCLKGYKVVLVIPKHYITKDRMSMLHAYGAKVIVCESAFGAHIETAKRLCNENPDYVYLNQFINPSNPNTHYKYTGKEIIEQISSPIDGFVCGVGTGGTLSGIAKRIKEAYPSVIIAAMQPKGCEVLKGIAVPHEIKGNVSAEGIPETFEVSLVDTSISVSFDRVKEIAKLLSTKEGLFLGISSCANIVAAIELAKTLGSGKTIATISHDFGNNYVDFYNELFSN